MKTNKIKLQGQIDGETIDLDFEFANLDKAGVIAELHSANIETVWFSDIHGRCFTLNYNRIKYFYINVIEIID